MHGLDGRRWLLSWNGCGWGVGLHLKETPLYPTLPFPILLPSPLTFCSPWATGSAPFPAACSAQGTRLAASELSWHPRLQLSPSSLPCHLHPHPVLPLGNSCRGTPGLISFWARVSRLPSS